MFHTRHSIAVVVVLACSAESVRAQARIERPVTFDSAQRVSVVSAPLAERLKLAAPAWPVRGEFREARLYSVEPGGGYVLAVQRPGGVIERYVLSEADRATLRSAVDVAMRIAGNPNGESGSDVMSEPAGNAFARRQTILALIVYGPLAASLSSDGPPATALYLLITGGTFFATYGGAQSAGFTRAQNALGGDLGLAGGTAAWLGAYALTGESDKPERAAALAGALAGTFVGITLGREMTDAEANAASAGVRSAALLTLAAAKSMGASVRGVAGAVAASEFVGYPIGLAYTRRASYTVTAGDVEATGTAGLVGVLYGAAFAGDLKHPSSGQYAMLGSAYLAGLLIGDRTIARRFDLTQSQSSAAMFGAFAGGLVGLALPVLVDSHSNVARYGATAVGATLGMAAVIGVSNPKAEESMRRGSALRVGRARFDAELAPFDALAAVRRMPGPHALLRLRF